MKMYQIARLGHHGRAVTTPSAEAEVLGTQLDLAHNGQALMQIDRVIFGLNENPLYADFWNIVSKVWAEVYKVTPTLAFVGPKSSIKKLNLSEEYGEIYQIDPTETNDKWEVTWSPFYLSTLFPDDVCMTSGIDQLPLGNTLFFDAVSKVEDDKLFVGFANGYFKSPPPHPRYMSSHLVGKGRIFKEVFSIGDNFDAEIKKIKSTPHIRRRARGRRRKPNRQKKHYNTPFWGSDEKYASPFLNRSSKVVFSDLYSTWKEKKLNRAQQGDKGTLQYDLEALKNNAYSEIHMPRPYCEHKEYLDKLVGDLLK